MSDTVTFKSKRIDITPDIPSRLTGMSGTKKSQGIHSNLEINAMVLSQQEKHIYIISIDTLFISKQLKAVITEEINTCFGSTPEADILILSTHTHFAPSLEEKRTDLGVKDQDYFNFLKNKITELIELLSAENSSAIEIEVSNGKTTNLTSNRRRKVRKLGAYFKPFIAMEPNLKGYKNEEFKLLKMYEAKSSKNLLGVIWTFPCHPTNLYDNTLISAEFPGEIRSLIREKKGLNDLSVVYMPGFSGDVRAYPPKRTSLSKTIRDLLQLSYPVNYYRFINKIEYDQWISTLANSFWGIWNHSQQLNSNDAQLSSQINKKKTSLLGIHVDGVEELIFRKVNIGTKIGFYTMSAETVSGYSILLDSIAKENFYICTGYTDEVFGYLPTQKQIREGGYESKDYFTPFLVTGNFNSSIEKTIELCIKEIN